MYKHSGIYASRYSAQNRLLGIKEKAEEEKNPEKKLLLKQFKASKKEKEALEKELDKEKDKNKRQALLLKREAIRRLYSAFDNAYEATRFEHLSIEATEACARLPA